VLFRSFKYRDEEKKVLKYYYKEQN